MNRQSHSGTSLEQAFEQDESWERKKQRFSLTAATLMCTLFFSGCIIVPVKTPTVIKAASGQKAKLPSETLVPGETTREQVETQYKAFAVECGIPNLFWGRFQKSSWAVAGGMFGAGAGASRMWGGHNLLASFDEKGVLRTFETVPDKELVARLVAMRKELAFPALDYSQPIQLEGISDFPYQSPVQFQLSATEVTVTGQVPNRDRKKPVEQQVRSIPAEKVMGVKVVWAESKNPADVQFEVRFSEKTVFGKKISFAAKPSVALTLVRWLEQAKNQ